MLVLVFYINPIGASKVGPGRIEFKPEANPSTTLFFERGLHLNSSRWFYRTPPTLIGHLQITPAKRMPPGGTGRLLSESMVGTS